MTDPETGNKDAGSEIDIEADGLRELLKEQIGNDYPGQNFDGDTVEMSAPFAPLVSAEDWATKFGFWSASDAILMKNSLIANLNHWTRFIIGKNFKKQRHRILMNDATKTQARKDLLRLLETVEAAPELEKYFKTRDSNLNASITTYETMWTLFPPKTKIVAKPFLNTLQVFEVDSAPIPYERRASRTLRVLAWYWDWTGKEMTKIYYYLPIDRFRGTKDTNQLPCYTIKYHKGGSSDDEEELCKKLKIRGAKYNKIVRSKPGATQMYSYNGETVSDTRSVIRPTENDAVSVGSQGQHNSSLIFVKRRTTVDQIMMTRGTRQAQGRHSIGKQSR